MSTVAPDQPGPLTHRQILVVMTGLLLGMLLSALDQTVLVTALPSIVGDLGGVGSLSWVITSYILAQTASLPLWGKIGDLLGRKSVFQFAVALFLLGSVVCGLAPAMGQLVAGRVLQGLGAGGIAALNWTIIGDIVAPRERGRYQGYSASVFAVSLTAGPVLGGFLVDNLSWRWVFFVNLPLGALSIVVTHVGLRVPFRRTGHVLDWPGAALLVGGSVCVLLVTEWGGTVHRWRSPTIVWLTVAGVVLLVACAWHERRAAEPVLPPRLFSNRVVLVAMATAGLAGYAQYTAVVYAPLNLQVVQGATATAAGTLMLPLVLGFLLSSAAAGQVISRTGRYRRFPAAGLTMAAGGLLLLSRLGPGTGTLTSTAVLVLTGTGFGMVQQVLVLASQNAVEHRDLGTATSTVGFFRFMGGAVGVAVSGSLLVARLGSALDGPVGAATGGLGVDEVRTSPDQLAALPPAVRDGVVDAFSHGLDGLFLAAVPVAVVGVLVASRLEGRPLREWAHVGHDPTDDPAVVPPSARQPATPPSSLPQRRAR